MSDVQAILSEAEKIHEAQGRIGVLENNNRRAIRLLTVGLVLDLFLSIGFLTLYVRQRSNTQNIHDACVQQDKANQANQQVWQFVLDSSHSPDQALVAKFQGLIRQAYPIQPC